MAKTFRDMAAWQLSFEIKEQVLKLLKAPAAARDFKFRDQLADSARSTPRNIAEGFGRYNPAEIAQFIGFARASLDETENHIRDGVASNYFPAEAAGPVIRLVVRCRKALAAWHTYLRTVQNDPKFRKRRSS